MQREKDRINPERKWTTHGLYSPWNSLGQNTGVGSLSLLQGVFPTHGLNPGLPHCRQILYQLSHRGSPRILEWVAYPSSRAFSRPRNRTRVSCIAGGFFNNWAMREAPEYPVIRDTVWTCGFKDINLYLYLQIYYTYIYVIEYIKYMWYIFVDTYLYVCMVVYIYICEYI